MSEKTPVTLKKEPTAIAMRFFREDCDYETQIMNECSAFFERYGVYPNAIVANPVTYDRWFEQIEDSAGDEDEDLENLTFEEIKAKLLNTLEDMTDESAPICEIGPSEDEKATMFKTPDYELFILENTEYQDGVYQLLNGYSPILENGKFSYPVIDMEATGKNIREIADRMGIKPTDIQNVCGLGSIQAVYKWFSGKSVPSIDNLGIISNLLNTTIDDLVVFNSRLD